MREEYPRPELVRKQWMNLNGEWDFAFDFGVSGVEMYFFDNRNKGYRFAELAAQQFVKKINVPFCPESKLSGICYTNFIGACCYRKAVKIPSDWNGRIILHFEAAFHTTYVTVNGDYVGSHKGGYTPFSFDITECVKNGEAEIFVYCIGDSRNPRQPSGKQSMTKNSVLCTYTRCTGIWQTVWLECVPKTYLMKIKTDADLDNACLYAHLQFSLLGQKSIMLVASLNGKEMGRITARTTSKELTVRLPLNEVHPWSVGNPVLYDLKILVETEHGVDCAESYFGMRKLEWDDKGFLLNGKRICLRMVLDQGYYREGIYTAPTAEALVRDIEISQNLGFNGARLHQKVFERRFLYECDKRGYLVWDEYPNWGFDYTTDSGLQYYLNEWMETVERDYNHPCVVAWVPLNETYWDVFGRKASEDFTRQLYLETKRFDASRPCVDASGGWHVLTDIFDTHDYIQDSEKFKRCYAKFNDGEIYNQEEGYSNKYGGQMFCLSEYGAIRRGNEGEAAKSEEEFCKRFVSFADPFLSNSRMAGFWYTQLYDVEQEQNGLYDYDRNPRFSEETTNKICAALRKMSAVEKE